MRLGQSENNLLTGSIFADTVVSERPIESREDKPEEMMMTTTYETAYAPEVTTNVRRINVACAAQYRGFRTTVRGIPTESARVAINVFVAVGARTIKGQLQCCTKCGHWVKCREDRIEN